MSPVDAKVNRGLTPVTGPSGDLAAELVKRGISQKDNYISPSDPGQQFLEASIAIRAAGAAYRLPSYAIPPVIRPATGSGQGSHH